MRRPRMDLFTSARRARAPAFVCTMLLALPVLAQDHGMQPARGVGDPGVVAPDAVVGGVQLGATQTVDNATVTDGRFTVELDFGHGVFGGGARWLDTTVRPGAGGAYTLLTPRQKLNPAP